ncbi:SCP2 sterol-binding domain-containing protein [Infirmifilum sp. NZ]|uniref:SCP2 sterol-binding domain-containing protein n=1 Tax=Infirmifilum sp. NZ TaxID=2926850 RepID=UPI0027A209A0|nr:SCP2 sterol-binding domain-containing protein [Infirmifilum sp. NZ]UNQ73538.1 SCP2 sterol-binding domain-containing protein [Infirmifilum sp. NZ]
MPVDMTTCILLDTVKRRLNSSEKFKSAARGWTRTILVKLTPTLPGLPYVYKTFITIRDGRCAEIRALEPEEEEKADITVEMSVSTFDALLRGEASSGAMVLRGRVKIKGKVFELLKRSAVLEEVNRAMRELIFGGKAIPEMLPYLKREFTF